MLWKILMSLLLLNHQWESIIVIKMDFRFYKQYKK